MTNSENAVVVFTGKSFDSILNEGGSQSWKLDAGRAKKCEYLVCTQNAHNPEAYADGTEPHGSAFLVGRISRISPATDGDASRWKIQFSEYARVNVAHAWTGDRNPVRYTTVESLGIDVNALDFEPFQEEPAAAETVRASAGLTIREAKAGLALTYDVDVESIEVVIRG
ncbi:hypothetical protein HQ308_19930 [Rhodococcus sp. BP-241]|uniref:hypothetical protein n=1 Tax=Rhodococcus sp. BP-241 TaxID=2739441 RepID=UPI001C9B3F08|nr:hypothetical protein [Rhodococcus sp. BP-241]MBY6709064.1 hypothetical protein [Rhodococcus sp. BP-241]